MARVRKPNPRAMPRYPTTGRIHMMADDNSAMRIAFFGSSFQQGAFKRRGWGMGGMRCDAKQALKLAVL